MHATDSLKGRIQPDQLLQHKLDFIRGGKVKGRLAAFDNVAKDAWRIAAANRDWMRLLQDCAAMPAEERYLAFSRNAVICQLSRRRPSQGIVGKPL